MMKSFSARFGRRGPVALALALSLPGLAACQDKSSSQNKSGAQTAVANPCGALAPTQTSALPKDPGNSQIGVDCSAWQAFIALNWKSDPANPGYPDPKAQWASFGAPSDVSPTVWESYAEASAVFSGVLQGQWKAKRPAVKPLQRTSKFHTIDLSGIIQAGGPTQWLTSQRGELTYYEVLMNRDEYEFITTQKLTTAAGQLACVTQPGKPLSDGPPPPPDAPKRGGLNFPVGMQPGWSDTDCVGNKASFGDGVGAMEIKAAWTPLPQDGSLDYRYKTAIAEIQDPTTRAKRQVKVGLVGIHITRKRFPKLPWVWATFEHIDNSPDEAADGSGGFSPPALPTNPNQVKLAGYTFFNTKCDPNADKVYRCRHNVAPTAACLLGSDPNKCQPYKAPMQITRINRVDNIANSVTAYAWSLMPPKSVFNYYRLINVQWPQAAMASPTPGPGLPVPLTMGNPAPSGAGTDPSKPNIYQIVANTTMETFVQRGQGAASCMDCHVYASIASPPSTAQSATGSRKVPGRAAPAKTYASDYSFIFSAETTK
jgi:hypothetical protein